MSRVVKLAGAAAGGSAGLSTADVTSLISTKGEWEYVDKYSLAASSSGFTIDGFDMATYRGYKIIYDDFNPGGNQNVAFRVRKAGGDFVSNNSFTMHLHGHNFVTSRGSTSSDIYWNANESWGGDSNDRMQSEIEIFQPVGSYNTYYGYAKISQKLDGGYHSTHAEGNFIGTRGSDDVVGIALQHTWSSGDAYLYRTLRRT